MYVWGKQFPSTLEGVLKTTAITDQAEQLDRWLQQQPADVLLWIDHFSIADALEVFDYLKQTYPSNRIIVSGTSSLMKQQWVAKGLPWIDHVGDWLESDATNVSMHSRMRTTEEVSVVIEPEKTVNGFVVTIYSPRGGIGKSSFAREMAYAYASKGSKTILLDFDIEYGNTIPTLQLDHVPNLMTWVEHDQDLRRLGKTPTYDETSISGYIQSTKHGFDVLAGALYPGKFYSVTDDPSVLRMILDVCRSYYDVVMVDVSSALNDATMYALKQSDRVIALSGMSVDHAYALHSFLSLSDLPPIEIIWVKRGKTDQPISDLHSWIGTKVTQAGEMEWDTKMPMFHDKQKWMFREAKRSSFSKKIEQLSTFRTIN